MGREEIDLIAPLLARLQADGIALTGPHSADTMFHAEARARYDVAICMYHDQALIPVKSLDFHGGANITLGLPFIRTSPDHGTAFDIAGQRPGQSVQSDRRPAPGPRHGAKGPSMSTLDGLPPLREVIADHGLSARKSLGQNFLLDLNLTAKIARQAGDLSACDVLEVGPGPGGLTRALLHEGARKVLAIEKDARCLPMLDDISATLSGPSGGYQGRRADG